MSTFLENLDWRYATKNFNSEKALSAEAESKILESIQMAPTSFGLQPFKVHVVKDSAQKEKIQQVGWNQPQYGSAPLVLVFTTLCEVDTRITKYLELASKGNEDVRKKLGGYEGMMRGFFKGKTEEWLHNWASRQAYIALGFAMAACAELKIDSCPMEGFNPVEVDKILGLGEKEKSSVILTVGTRAEGDTPKEKTRFPKSEIFA